MLAILFPAIDPVAIQIGPLAIRWYALAYLIGFVAGWRYCIYLARKDDRPPTAVGLRRLPDLGGGRRHPRRTAGICAVL